MVLEVVWMAIALFGFVKALMTRPADAGTAK
jgi:hypothetical protein